MKRVVNILQQWSIPLIAGVFVALLFANTVPHVYHTLVHDPIPSWFTGSAETHESNAAAVHTAQADHPEQASPDAVSAHHAVANSANDHAQIQAAEPEQEQASEEGWGEYLTLHFLINDVFMVFFFGIATKEIVESCLPGGALNPIRKAVNPLLGTIGGVLGPIGMFLLLNLLIGDPQWVHGWGIPTATDIALAWLVARFVFGQDHPAVNFLLLLAVADDAIGLGIIAFGYPDPQHPTFWLSTAWILPGMIAALAFRLLKVRQWWLYILVGGAFSWWGLFSANLHPALALVPIVPFLPAAKRDMGLFEEEANYAELEGHGRHHSPLEKFEHNLKFPVDFGLFAFAFANAGVGFSSLNNLTWIVLLALMLGKTIGITGFSYVGTKIGFPLPSGMSLRHLFTAAVVAGTGLTVALFVAGQAFALPAQDGIQSAAKMGALFSGGVAIVAYFIGRALPPTNSTTMLKKSQHPASPS